LKTIQFLTAITILTLLFSCGQSEQEKKAVQEAQKQRDDSIARVAAQKAQQQQQQQDADAVAFKAQKENAMANLKSYQQLLEQYNADLAAANTKMTEIKSEDCWLQSCKDAKVKNVRNQTLVIERINDAITALQIKISDIKTKYSIQ
jgi:hypothetical protein